MENPWRTLRDRPHLTLLWRHLPNGMGGLWKADSITLDPRLSQTERRCALMHELVHEDRRIGWPFASAGTMETEERIVREETARRLVPPDELLELVQRCDDIEPVTATVVAREFDVTPQVAFLALRRLQVDLLEAEMAREARHVPASKANATVRPTSERREAS